MNNQKSVEDILSSVADVTVHSNAVQHLVRDSSDQPHERTIADAIELLFHASQIDGAHHKAWVIDQALRILTGANYPQAVAEYSFDGLDLTEGKAEYYQQVIDGFAGDDEELERIEENYYSWDTGIAP